MHSFHAVFANGTRPERSRDAEGTGCGKSRDFQDLFCQVYSSFRMRRIDRLFDSLCPERAFGRTDAGAIWHIGGRMEDDRNVSCGCLFYGGNNLVRRYALFEKNESHIGSGSAVFGAGKKNGTGKVLDHRLCISFLYFSGSCATEFI